MKRLLISLLLATPSLGTAQSVCIPAEAPSASSWQHAAAKPPADAPQAMPIVHTEGLLPHEGIHDQSDAAKKDWGHMRNLALAWHVAADRAALSQLAVYLDAWMKTYRLSFDPIDESGLDSVVDAYTLTAADLPKPTEERTRQFLHDMAEGYLTQMDQHTTDSHSVWINNWQSHRIALATLSSAAIGDNQLFARAQRFHHPAFS